MTRTMAKLLYVTVSESKQGSLSYTRHISPDHRKAICGVSVENAPVSTIDVTMNSLDTGDAAGWRPTHIRFSEYIA